MVTVIHFLDPAAQGNCTITTLNPTTGLKAYDGGLAIFIGTKNVMIQCNCTDDDGRVVVPVRWYDPDGAKLRSSYRNQFDATVPHFTRVTDDDDDSNIILVIPTFNYSYDGTYACGWMNNGRRLGMPYAVVTLTIVGELMINWHIKRYYLKSPYRRLCMDHDFET